MVNGGKPVKKFKAGSVIATVWKNNGEKDGHEVEYFTVSLERSYKVGEQWKNTSSFRVQDISDAGLVIGKTNEFLRLKDAMVANTGSFVAASEI